LESPALYRGATVRLSTAPPFFRRRLDLAQRRRPHRRYIITAKRKGVLGMRRGLVAAVLVTATAGVAAASILPAPAPRAVAAPGLDLPARPAAAVAPGRPALAPSVLPPSALPMPARGAGGSPSAAAPSPHARAREARQAPVPVLLATRPPYVPAVEREAAADRNAAKEESKESTEGAAAKAAIEADGYKGVRGLARAGNGTWRARALRGTTEIQVSVDAQGRVSAD
jgi:hypothetical protein